MKFRLLLLVALIPTIIIDAQVTQPEGIYSNSTAFIFEDPDYSAFIEMSPIVEPNRPSGQFSAYGIRELIRERKAEDLPWAIVSDSSFFLNMRTFSMGKFYIKLDSLCAYPYFPGENFTSKEVKQEKLERGLSFSGLVPKRSGSREASKPIFSKIHHPNDLRIHHFLSMKNGMIYVLNLKNVLAICTDATLREEIEQEKIINENIPLLYYYLQKINYPSLEIEKPTILEQDEEIIEDNE